MLKNKILHCGLATLLLFGAVGCKDLPGSKESQGAVIGGVSGAAVGTAVGGEKHRLLGALLGGALGAGAGYVIGAHSDKITGNDTNAATRAIQNSTQYPATAAQARTAPTADINGDGFVTLDEVLAMKQAGLTDDQMIAKLQATGQVFELTAEQQKYLTDQGISPRVVSSMQTINQDQKQQLLNQRGDVIGRPSTAPATNTAPRSAF